jgi:thymidine phosphorylase
LHTDTPERFSRAREALQGAYGIGETAPEMRPLILGRIA